MNSGANRVTIKTFGMFLQPIQISGIGCDREDDIEELIMGDEDELTTEELQEILNEEHQETQRNVSPSEQEEDERRPMPISVIKDVLKKWEGCQSNGLRMAPIPS
ncbi:uncharacterized protein TNCV_160691 [Trichonephila clavipes]|nr:uncharacterized protein TNCV_160691 [Trichonephila clavipes]